MNPKLLIVLVVILVILYVIGTGAAVFNSRDSGPPSLKQDWLSGFGNLFTQHVSVDDLTPVSAAACSLNALSKQISAGSGTCIYTIKSSDSDVRKFVIQGISGTVAIDQIDSFTGVLGHQTTSSPKELSVSKNAATLTITCPSSCTIQLA